MTWEIIHGDCREELKTIADESIDAVITDPPYPHIKRDYGYWTTEEWWKLIVKDVIPEMRRILKPTGSAVFILQPNSEHVGQLRGWLWEFMAWVCREWNMVQDVWWWDYATIPSGVCIPRERGLLRASVKGCVWCGPPSCYRNQEAVLWSETERNKARRQEARYSRSSTPSGQGTSSNIHDAAQERDGVTPFNLLPIATWERNSHGASTPLKLANWWTRYIVPSCGTVLDPFCGSGTMGVAALQNNYNFIGIEKEAEYCKIAEKRLNEMPILLF